MIISIDYDGTYTRDAHTFNNIITMLQVGGHTVVVCTNRPANDKEANVIENIFNDLNVPVIFAGHKYKREALSEAGYKVDVFIDDMPETISAPISIIGGN